MEYLIGSGLLKRSQVDGSYDGSPARFVATGGEVAQSGYATADPYLLEKEVKDWGKPVKFQLVYDTGYPNHGEVLVIRAGDKDKLAPCLRKLVPIVQQAQVDILANPAQTIELLVRVNGAYKAGLEPIRAAVIAGGRRVPATVSRRGSERARPRTRHPGKPRRSARGTPLW